jgi:hypothetical protein
VSLKIKKWPPFRRYLGEKAGTPAFELLQTTEEEAGKMHWWKRIKPQVVSSSRRLCATSSRQGIVNILAAW